MTTTNVECKTDVKYRITYKDTKTGNVTNLYVYTEHDALHYTKWAKDSGYEILSRVKITETQDIKRSEIIMPF